MTSSTSVIQVTNVSPSSTAEQMRTLFGFIGTIDELRLFPPDSGVIPDESKALSLLAPANAVAGLLPGGGLLPTPNPVTSMGGVSLGGLGGPNLDPMAALALAAPNINTQALSAEQLMKLMASIDPKLNHLASGLNLSSGLKTDSNKEIEEAMKRVREAQSLISAAIEPGSKKDDKRKRSRSRSRRRRSRSRSRHRRSKSHSRRRSGSRSRRRSKSPRRRKSHSRDRGRRSRSRDRRKDDKSRKRSKTPPKSYSSARRSRSTSRKRHRRSRSASRSPKKSRSPKRKLSRSPSPRRHKKEKKKDKDRERDRKDDWDRNRDKRERSDSKKSKDKDRDRDRDRKSDSEKGDVKVTRDYDEEEQGYDSEHERNSDAVSSPHAKELRADSAGRGESDGHSEDQRDEDMDMSD